MIVYLLFHLFQIVAILLWFYIAHLLMEHKQNLVCFNTFGDDESWSIEAYEKRGGYEAWRKILAGKMTPDEVIESWRSVAVVDLVEAGLGIAILPKWFILPHTGTKQIHTCHLTSKKTRLQWKAGFLKENTIPAFQKEFIKHR